MGLEDAVEAVLLEESVEETEKGELVSRIYPARLLEDC